jgi:hypothetical protein
VRRSSDGGLLSAAVIQGKAEADWNSNRLGRHRAVTTEGALRKRHLTPILKRRAGTIVVNPSGGVKPGSYRSRSRLLFRHAEPVQSPQCSYSSGASCLL